MPKSSMLTNSRGVLPLLAGSAADARKQLPGSGLLPLPMLQWKAQKLPEPQGDGVRKNQLPATAAAGVGVARTPGMRGNGTPYATGIRTLCDTLIITGKQRWTLAGSSCRISARMQARRATERRPASRGGSAWMWNLSCFAMFCLLGGCTLLPWAMTPQTGTAASEAFPPLRYHVWAQIAQAEELQSERQRLLYLYETELLDPVVAAVQLALLDLALPASPEDERAALARLDSVMGRSGARGDGDYRVFAGLLRSHLELKVALHDARLQTSDTASEISRLKESNRQLQDKINALTNIEQQLILREQEGEP